MSGLTGTFQYVFIPADASAPVEVRTASKAGGLENDVLVEQAKAYFSSQNSTANTSTPSPEEQATALAQLKQQIASMNSPNKEQLLALPDQQLLQKLQTSSTMSSCDITALTVPTRANQYQAVSMYANAAASTQQQSVNKRATALLTACGHAERPIHGDVFVGRAHDDEASDVWQRVDFDVSEADAATAEWCRVAKGPGGGGGSGKGAASLQGIMQQQQQPQQQQQQLHNSYKGANNESAAAYGMNGSPAVQEEWGQWTQTNDDVEVQLMVPPHTKAKDAKVQFGRKTLHVTVSGQERIPKGQTTLFDSIQVDDSTYTIEDSRQGTERILILTLAKVTTGKTWEWVVR